MKLKLEFYPRPEVENVNNVIYSREAIANGLSEYLEDHADVLISHGYSEEQGDPYLEMEKIAARLISFDFEAKHISAEIELLKSKSGSQLMTALLTDQLKEEDLVLVWAVINPEYLEKNYIVSCDVAYLAIFPKADVV